MVAAGHNGGEEGTVLRHLGAVFHGMFEQPVVRQSPCADRLVGREAMLSYDGVEAVGVEEFAHVVVILVMGHEKRVFIADLVQMLGQTAHHGKLGLLHRVARQDGWM